MPVQGEANHSWLKPPHFRLQIKSGLGQCLHTEVQDLDASSAVLDVGGESGQSDRQIIDRHRRPEGLKVVVCFGCVHQ